jgi:hypothetical protein
MSDALSDPLWRDQVRAVVERTCAEQGVPLYVTDARVVDQIVVLLGRGGVAGGRTGSAERECVSGAAGSESPEWLDPLDGN